MLIATDPLGLLSGVLEKMLGIKSDILFQPVAPTRPAREQTAPANARKTEHSRAVGLSVRLNIAW